MGAAGMGAAGMGAAGMAGYGGQGYGGQGYGGQGPGGRGPGFGSGLAGALGGALGGTLGNVATTAGLAMTIAGVIAVVRGNYDFLGYIVCGAALLLGLYLVMHTMKVAQMGHQTPYFLLLLGFAIVAAMFYAGVYFIQLGSVQKKPTGMIGGMWHSMVGFQNGPGPEGFQDLSGSSMRDIASALNIQGGEAALKTDMSQQDLLNPLPFGKKKPEPVDTTRTLLNTQPLAIKQAGYISKDPKTGDGSFSPEDAVQQGLRAGFRFFILQIDYMDMKKKGFEETHMPTLLFRDSSGKLLSSNSGSIAKVAQILAENAFRPDVSKHDDLLVLYLHIVRAPNPKRNPKEYLQYLSRIASALAPLAPTHLGLTPFGSFHRQKMESNLVTTPLEHLRGKTVVITNADTSLFRNSEKLFDAKFEPNKDLDFWSNMRVYLNSPADSIGITTIADETVTPVATILTTKDILSGPKAEQSAFTIQSKQRFTIAMPDPIGNPSVSDVSILLNDLGVNVVPLDLFGVPVDSIKKYVMEWDSLALRKKPAALLSI